MTRSFNQSGSWSHKGTRILSIIALLASLMAACTPEPPPSTPTSSFPTPIIPDLDLPISSRDFLVGTAGLIPPHFPDPTEEDYLEFLAELPHTGEIVGVYTDWSAPDLINSIQFAETHAIGVDPLVAIGFDFEIVDDTYFSRNLPGIRTAIREVLNSFELDYLAFGVESNRLGPEVSQAAWMDYVAAYHEIYDLVKLHSPETKVFPIFQLEYLKGAAMLSGLEMEPQWELINDFNDKIDLIGLTIYPFLEYTSVDQVPADYYAEIPQKIHLPIAITEMAWISEDVSIVEGSETAQVEFLLRILDETRDWDLEMMLYSFLYEPRGVDLFESAALKTYDGKAKDVYQYWLVLADLE